RGQPGERAAIGQAISHDREPARVQRRGVLLARVGREHRGDRAEPRRQHVELAIDDGAALHLDELLADAAHPAGAAAGQDGSHHHGARMAVICCCAGPVTSSPLRPMYTSTTERRPKSPRTYTPGPTVKPEPMTRLRVSWD